MSPASTTRATTFRLVVVGPAAEAPPGDALPTAPHTHHRLRMDEGELVVSRGAAVDVAVEILVWHRRGRAGGAESVLMAAADAVVFAAGEGRRDQLDVRRRSAQLVESLLDAGREPADVPVFWCGDPADVPPALRAWLPEHVSAPASDWVETAGLLAATLRESGRWPRQRRVTTARRLAELVERAAREPVDWERPARWGTVVAVCATLGALAVAFFMRSWTT